MNDFTVKIAHLPDLSMAQYAKKYGPVVEECASQATYSILSHLRAEKNEWLIVRYAYDPRAASPYERLKIYLKAHTTKSAQGLVRGAHLLDDIFHLAPSSATEAFEPMQGQEASIYIMDKTEEIFLDEEQDRLHYAVTPYVANQAQALDPVQLDSLLHRLQAPCLIDLAIKPTALSIQEKNTLIHTLKNLERLSSSHNLERCTSGAFEEVVSARDPIVKRHRDFLQRIFDDILSRPVFEHSVRVMSADPDEGAMVAQAFGHSLIPDGLFEAREIAPGNDHYTALTNAFQEFNYRLPPHRLANGLPCYSPRLAGCDAATVKALEKQFEAAAVLSRFKHVVRAEFAVQLLRLPSSRGNLFDTILLESEKRGHDETKLGQSPRIEIGPQLGRSGTAYFYLHDCTKHFLITGASGSGKTHTTIVIAKQLWEKHGVPFLVLVPVLSPYRILLRSEGSLSQDLRIFSLGNDRLSPLRLNPFQPCADEVIENQISDLCTCFSGAIESEGPLPGLILDGLEETYRAAGFRLTDIAREKAKWPTMQDFVRVIEKLIREEYYAGELKDNMISLFKSRLAPLCKGPIGRTFSGNHSLPTIEYLFQWPTTIEMSALNGEQQKFIALYLLSARRQRLNREGPSKTLKHLLVLEEAKNFF